VSTRTQCCCVSIRLRFGVPQGVRSRTAAVHHQQAELNHIVASHHFNLNQYAENCQIHAVTPPSQSIAAAYKLAGCLTDVYLWMGARRLRLNPTKTQIMWLGSKQQPGKSRKQGYQCSVDISPRCGLRHAIWASFWTASSPWLHTSPCYVGLDITNSGSFDPSFVHCRSTPLKPSSRFSPTVAWITVMRC
jgi:hypothetical protein